MASNLPFPPKKKGMPPPQMRGGKNSKADARQDAIKRRMQKNGDKPGGY